MPGPKSLLRALFLILAIPVVARADIIWMFETRNDSGGFSPGAFSGRLTTSGNTSSLTSANTFAVTSIDAVDGYENNGAWYNGVAPPFNHSVTGAISWVPGIGGSVQGDRIMADGPISPLGGRDFISIARPGSGDQSFVGEGVFGPGSFHIFFEPTSTTFSPVAAVPEIGAIPVISSFFCSIIWIRLRRPK